MFSLQSGSDPKKRKENGKRPINKKDQKQAKIFSKGVTRFLNYNKDLLPGDKFKQITELREKFLSTAEDSSNKRKDLDDMSDNISKVCKKAIPDFQPSLVKENIEVLFVAVVIAMGIRAYFIQQFKIPTGSMQPTLNGIIAYPADEVAYPGTKYKASVDYKKPNPVKRLIDSVWFGRSHVEWKEKKDGDSFSYRGIEGRSPFIIFPKTYLTTEFGQKYSSSGTADRVAQLLDRSRSGVKLKKGDIIARGYVETGDMLVVNKMAYHWSKPKRGQVFVFHTRNINYIQRTLKKEYGSQHYIKRLVGIPGDHLKVEPPYLMINGKQAEEFGIKRVAQQKGLYTGYVRDNQGKNEFQLGPKQYLAFGDNSSNSSDSRRWGHVPEENIVGRAMFVFYPFGNHFGPIR